MLLRAWPKSALPTCTSVNALPTCSQKTKSNRINAVETEKINFARGRCAHPPRSPVSPRLLCRRFLRRRGARRGTRCCPRGLGPLLRCRLRRRCRLPRPLFARLRVDSSFAALGSMKYCRSKFFFEIANASEVTNLGEVTNFA